MLDGDFTGKGLNDYIDYNQVDYFHARRIVNGVERAKEIAHMAAQSEEAIRLGLRG
jgi:hypothetical protein